jgi:hypothetical protein
MGRVRIMVMAAGLLLLVATPACTGGGGEEGRTSSTRSGTNGGPETVAGTTATNEDNPTVLAATDFGQSLFDENSATIDNKWVPLKPGTRFVWDGSTEEEGERIPHRIVFTVIDLTKVVDGVRTRVGWDRDFSDGQLVEAELIFLAQDMQGDVWHFGQYSEEWEDGEFGGGQAWLEGYLKGAKAGIYMPANPRLGTPAYSEGFAPPPFFWDDWGKVYKAGKHLCVPVDCYDDVLVIDEFEPRKPGAHQLKYYAPGIGNIRTGWRGTDPDKEVLVLSKVLHLSAQERARAQAEALKLETRASLYGRTPPSQPSGASSSSQGHA